LATAIVPFTAKKNFYNSHWRCHYQQVIDAPSRAKVFLLLAVFGGSIHDRMRKHYLQQEP
jgi:hypothetical protein